MIVTVDQLTTRALDRADYTGSDYPDADALVGYVDDEHKSLWSELVQTHEDHFVVRKLIDIDSGAESYLLPGDFSKLRAVFHLDSSGRRERIRKSSLHEMARDDLDDATDYSPSTVKRYRLVGRLLILMHASAASSGQIELWYVAGPPDLSVGSDLISDMLPPTAADYIAEGCAARLIERAERDPSAKLRRQAVLLAQMRETMHDRDLWEPDAIIDSVYGYDDLI